MIVNEEKYKFATKCVFGSETWFNIGKLIYLISKGSNDGYELWLKYSRFDHEKFRENLCYNLWSNFDELMPEEYDSDCEMMLPEDYNELTPSNIDELTPSSEEYQNIEATNDLPEWY